MQGTDKKTRVVITGMGAVTPVAHNVQDLWSALTTGKSGAAKTTIFDASTFPTTFSAEVKDYNLADHIENVEPHKNSSRGSSFVLGAGAQACKQAGIDTETDSPADGIDRSRMGIYLGAGEGSVDNEVFFNAIGKSWNNETKEMDWQQWADYIFTNMKPQHEIEQEPNMAAGHLAVLSGARGPVRSCLTACAASTQAVGEAFMLLRSGRADIILAGGAHSMIHPLGLTGFNRLTALSTRNDDPETASRPFTASRDGFVLGEGAAVLVMETLESAKKRNAKILAEIIGYGSTADAFRVTDMHEDARGGTAAILAALKDANLGPSDIDYINTHGTSTTENDSIETLAIKNALGDKAKTTPVSSCKGYMGHLIGAAGASEIVSCIVAIHEQTLPPTGNLHDQDPQLDLDYVPNEPRKAKCDTVMKESFGFGGQNNVVILRKFNE